MRKSKEIKLCLAGGLLAGLLLGCESAPENLVEGQKFNDLSECLNFYSREDCLKMAQTSRPMFQSEEECIKALGAGNCVKVEEDPPSSDQTSQTTRTTTHYHHYPYYWLGRSMGGWSATRPGGGFITGESTHQASLRPGVVGSPRSVSLPRGGFGSSSARVAS